MNRNRTAFMSMTALGVIAAAAGTASATQYDSFLQGASFTGLAVAGNLSSPNLTFTVTLNAGATLTYNSNTYSVERIIGFYLLAPGFNDGAQPSLSSVNGFNNDSATHNHGSVLGWRSNPNDGITAGNSETFTFPSINYAQYTMVGFHIFLNANQDFPGTSGNTGSVTVLLGDLVPTPGAAAILGIGSLAAMRRRRP